jgi:CRP-like cAMP-binding protein
VNVADLKSFSLLSELSHEDREALFDLLEAKNVRKGRSIYRETSEAEGLVFIVSGAVRLVSKRTPEQSVIEAPSVLGAASLLCLGPNEATAKAEANCELLLLPRPAYRRFVEDAPRAACRLTEGIAAELSSLRREGLDSLVGPRGAERGE